MGDDNKVVLSGDERRIKGLETEKRFFAAFKPPALKRHPRWLFNVRKATKQEDHKGIDAVLTVYVQCQLIYVPVQIKSSERMVREHRKRYQNQQCIIVVPSDWSPIQIRERTCKRIYMWLGIQGRGRQPPLF